MGCKLPWINLRILGGNVKKIQFTELEMAKILYFSLNVFWVTGEEGT